MIHALRFMGGIVAPNESDEGRYIQWLAMRDLVNGERNETRMFLAAGRHGRLIAWGPASWWVSFFVFPPDLTGDRAKELLSQ